MRKLLLLCIFIGLCFDGIAQLYGSYIHKDIIPDTNLSISYKLSLYSGHCYTLQVLFGNDEFYWEQTLSSGVFDMVWDTLLLSDNYYDIKMSFQLFENEAIPIKCISGIEEKVFHSFLSVFDEKCFNTNRYNYYSVFNIKMSNKYGSTRGFMLELFENMTYQYSCYGHIISTGTWQRKHNKLLLQDHSLAKPFICTIKKGKLMLFDDEINTLE